MGAGGSSCAPFRPLLFNDAPAGASKREVMDTFAIVPLEWVFFVAASLLILGILASKISSWFNAPVLVMFLAVGMLAGSEGVARLSFIAWEGIEFSNYHAANFIGSLALCYILFAGGLGINWKSVRPALATGGVLASVGVFLTALVVALCCSWLLDMPFANAMLLGAIISSTDAAAVFAVLRAKGVGVKGSLKPLLELESGSNDPMAAFLTVFMISVVTAPETHSYWEIPISFLTRMSVGVSLGLAAGWASVRVFNKLALDYDGLYFVLGMGIVLFCYGLAEIAGGNGFMAVFVCGMVMGNQKFLYHNGFKKFNDGISWLMQVSMFLMLGLLVSPARLLDMQLMSKGLVAVFVLMFIARPAAVYLCMLGSEYTWRERTLVSWVGLRGAAPIVLATFPAIHGVPGYDQYFTIVFFIVLISVLVQGRTLMPAARALKLDKPFVTQPRAPLEFEQTDTIKGEMYEHEVAAGSGAADRPIRDLHLPKKARILMIRRGEGYVVPDGNTVIRAGDGLMFLTEQDVFLEAHQLLSRPGKRVAEPEGESGREPVSLPPEPALKDESGAPSGERLREPDAGEFLGHDALPDDDWPVEQEIPAEAKEPGAPSEEAHPLEKC